MMATKRREAHRTSSATARDAESVLRARYEVLWQDVQRELGKYRNEQYDDLVQQAADPDDVAQAALLIDLNLAEIDRDIDEMRDIHHALERVKRGAYGICESCGEAIDPQRLEVLPQAALCASCQARAEKPASETPSL